ncbi:MAG: amidohydrolase family protein [Rhodospirillaceae bacterium]
MSEFTMPAGTCDTHMHIYGPRDKYAEAPTSPFPPPNAPLPAYREIMTLLGIERCVIVQPASYGKDNSCTLDAIAEMDGRARGIAVVDTETSDAEMRRLTDAGFRGARLHMFGGQVFEWDELEGVANRVQDFDWHVQIQFNGREMPERAALIERFPGTVVIDHVGKFMDPVPPDHEAFQTMLRLVDRGNVWVKLSAVYEVSLDGPPNYADTGALARELVKRAPERMLWASNWPHPSVTDKPDEIVLRDAILSWMGDDATRRRILVDNPAELYGF